MKLEKILGGENICIRDYQKSDLSFATSMWFDEENGRYMSDPTADHVDAVYQQALDTLEDSVQGYYLMIVRKGSGEPVGTCCAFPDGTGTYDIGYCIHKDFWRRGYATEAVQLLLAWVRAQGGTKVTAEVAIENTASNRLLKKCGFTVEKEAEFKKYNMDIRYKSRIYQRLLT